MNYGKFANTYKNGKIISKKDKYGRTRDYTISELEELIDELAEDKDENGKVKDPQALNNASAILFQMYQRYGNPHEKELIEAIKKMQQERSLEEQKQDALDEVNTMLSDNDGQLDTSNNDGNDDTDAESAQNGTENEEYVEFEEIKNEAA
jgi:hypothetical protein